MSAKIIRSTEGQFLMGGRQIIKLTAADTDNQLSVIYSVVPAGSGIPVHVHSLEDETFEITEGKLEVTLDGETYLLGKGDMVFMPKNIPHGFRAVQDTQMWITLVPSGAENMFAELAALPPGPPDMKKIATIAEGYGIQFI